MVNFIFREQRCHGSSPGDKGCKPEDLAKPKSSDEQQKPRGKVAIAKPSPDDKNQKYGDRVAGNEGRKPGKSDYSL